MDVADSEAPGVDRLDEVPEDQDPPGELDFVPVPPAADDDEYRFDAFDENTWHFDPAAAPWYRGRSAVLGIVAVVIGVVALIVSVALLASRPDEDRVPARQTSVVPPPSSAVPSSTTRTPVTTATIPDTGSAEPPAPLPAPAAPAPAPAEQAPAPATSEAPQPTRKPELNVTRAPISVAPQQRGAR